MNAHLAWGLLAALALLTWIALGFLREQAEARNRLRLREMLHRERMAALEKGIDMPETDTDDLLQQSFSRPEPREAAPQQYDRALRRAVLGVGLVLLLGGVGWWLGMGAVPSTQETLGMPELASLGLIPLMVGVGLLLFWVALGRER